MICVESIPPWPITAVEIVWRSLLRSEVATTTSSSWCVPQIIKNRRGARATWGNQIIAKVQKTKKYKITPEISEQRVFFKYSSLQSCLLFVQVAAETQSAESRSTTTCWVGLNLHPSIYCTIKVFSFYRERQTF